MYVFWVLKRDGFFLVPMTYVLIEIYFIMPLYHNALSSGESPPLKLFVYFFLSSLSAFCFYLVVFSVYVFSSFYKSWDSINKSESQTQVSASTLGYENTCVNAS